ncbi:MAG TPA: fumarylacetoacetate hydrolase family protein [Armatimonadota bacterium]|nr:fumarylacetoacetate hydrolase family protein [Armatimonadota bacterium]
MKLTKTKWEGRVTAAIVEEGFVRPIPNYNILSLIERSEIEKTSLSKLAGMLASAHPISAEPVLPLSPREVWACGRTYGAVPQSPSGEARPVIFFKGTTRNCVGPGEPIGIRPDSACTIPEAELAVVLGSHGAIVGYTLANDVSAIDIDREDPGFQPQAKLFDACCALGPAIVTADELTEPYSLELACTITRAGETIFSASANTSGLNRKIETLVEYLLRGNSVPRGSVLLTGCGLRVPPEAALQPGDICSISAPEIGELTNPVSRLS